jgi:hypothetical protein
MILNTSFFTMFYGNAIPLLYYLSIAAFISLYLGSFIVFRHFSCKPVMFDHSLNLVISRVLCLALVIHQFTSILFFYTDDIFPLYTSTKNSVNKLLIKGVQGLHFIIFAVFFMVFTFNYTKICNLAKNYFYQYFNQKLLVEKQPRRFSEVFGESNIDDNLKNSEFLVSQTRKSDYLSSYNM